MNIETAIKVTNLSKVYQLRQSRIDKDGNSTSEHWALKDVSFEIKKGESVGIIGPNGSGKSTLLKILAGVAKPTTGSVSIHGKVASILDIGAGFHPELSGRENIFLNGQIHGFSKKEIESKFEEMVTFSGIENFIDEPVKNYSNGMYLRLAFSIMAHLEFDVYLFDEVLSVGDFGFIDRTKNKINYLIDNGKTIIVVSHSLQEIENYQKFIYFDKGNLLDISSKKDFLTRYREKNIRDNNQIIHTKNVTLTDFSNYKESNVVKLLKVELLQEEDNDFVSDKPFNLTIEYEKSNTSDKVNLFIIISDILGVPLITTSPLTAINSNYNQKTYRFLCEIPSSIFGFQTYKISVLFIDYKKNISNKTQMSFEKDEISQIKKTIITYNDLILFKTNFKFQQTKVYLEEINVGSGLMPSWKWDQLI